MIRKLTGILVVIAFTILAGCAVRQPVPLRVNGDMAAAIEIGQMLEVELATNPTTGYSWQLEVSPPDGIVRRVGEGDYSASSDLVGAGGTTLYRFTGDEKGQAIVVFKYLRTWEKGIAPVKTYNLTITVR